MAEVTMTLEEYQDLEDKLSTLAMANHNLKEERDSFRKQRDELINDMAEVKRKAEAWDKLKEYVLDRNEAFSDRKDCAQSPQQFEYFENLLTAFKVIKTKMNDLERGSDE
uniref:Uncharacterized protein n=1 Tax=Staphylococcus phage HS12 TaxID=3056402 RepID=A0AA50ACI3_9VIRU|nr:MAG: protein of unknown function (DUF1024) [Staphylococcus phage HS12]